MSEPQFPPAVQMSTAARMAELETCKFLSVRKAVTDTYRNPDGTPLMTYGETLDERGKVRQKVIDHEMAQGWLVADGSPGVIAVPEVVVATPAPTGAPFMPNEVAASAPQVQVASAPPQLEAPTEMVTTRVRRTAKPNLGAAVAPPPITNQVAPSGPPAPPLGATVLQAPASPSFLPAMVQQQQTNPPFAPASPVAIASPVSVVAGAPVNVDLTPVLMGLQAIISKVDNIGAGLTAVSEQTEKLDVGVKAQLSVLRSDVDIIMAAMHHLYTATPQLAGPAANAKKSISTIIEFKQYIGSFLPR